MKRIQVQLSERTLRALRRRALARGCSLSALVRALLAQALGTSRAKRRRSMKDFTFIGAGRSRQGRLSPVSERHDEALVKSLA